MTNRLVKRKPKTAKQMNVDISAIIDKRSIQASQSQYDKSVCVSAIGAVRDTVQCICVEGTAIEYGQAVLAVLSDLHDSYNDPDGKYTSGKAPIGDALYDVSRLVNDLISHEL